MDINYLGRNKVLPDIKFSATEIRNKRLYILGYQIVPSDEDDYLKFIFVKNKYLNSLDFPSIDITDGFLNDTSLNIESTQNYSKLFILNTIGVEIKNEYIDEIKCDGFLDFEENLFLLMDLSQLKFSPADIFTNIDTIWLVTVYELLNRQQVYDRQVNIFVLDFFNKNPDFLVLTDSNEKEIETPIIGYCIKPVEKVSFCSYFGKERESYPSKFGEFFYFDTFDSIMNKYKSEFNYKNNFITYKRSENVYFGIIRFALFMKKCKIVEPTEYIIEKTSYCQGVWSEQFDSLHIGNQDGPVFIVKSENQQIPISFHYLNSNNYSIYNN